MATCGEGKVSNRLESVDHERQTEVSGEGRRVLGMDAAGPLGWVGVLLLGDRFADALVGTAKKLIEWAEPVAVIPMHPDRKRARRQPTRGRRGTSVRRTEVLSVFAAPPREVVTAADYASANATLAELGAPKLSQQAWALIPKIVEAEAIAERDKRVVEVHPEVSFRHLAGRPLAWSKKSWNGLLLRRDLLAGAGIALPDLIPGVAGAAADDVVDPAAAAWLARRIATGAGRSLPDPPQLSDGRRVAIWY